MRPTMTGKPALYKMSFSRPDDDTLVIRLAANIYHMGATRGIDMGQCLGFLPIWQPALALAG